MVKRFIRTIEKLIELDALIMKECSGSPAELRDELGISEYQLRQFLEIIKELKSPVSYDRKRKSYVYTDNKNRLKRLGDFLNT